jgi:S1-C subfamily serine protease
LQRALGSDTVGKTMALQVLRAGELREVAIAVGERPHDDD